LYWYILKSSLMTFFSKFTSTDLQVCLLSYRSKFYSATHTVDSDLRNPEITTLCFSNNGYIDFTILSTDRFSEVMSRQQMLEFKTLHETFNPIHL
jgi:hypothetical protein